MFWVYAIRNKANGKIYVGQTADLAKRLDRHNSLLPNKKSSYTHKIAGTWELVYKEEHVSRSDALKRERELKSFQGRVFLKKKIGCAIRPR